MLAIATLTMTEIIHDIKFSHAEIKFVNIREILFHNCKQTLNESQRILITLKDFQKPFR